MPGEHSVQEHCDQANQCSFVKFWLYLIARDQMETTAMACRNSNQKKENRRHEPKLINDLLRICEEECGGNRRFDEYCAGTGRQNNLVPPIEWRRNGGDAAQGKTRSTRRNAGTQPNIENIAVRGGTRGHNPILKSSLYAAERGTKSNVESIAVRGGTRGQNPIMKTSLYAAERGTKSNVESIAVRGGTRGQSPNTEVPHK
ncbi:hypothetical protein R3P38DRAFT_2778588 [Favolaschia claudopus]|uniref:Uncharacterized protein n=1 Tax=Favolaschia claudopus TaxID=2862362 RepID=A0AAW0BIT4_9AGAR